MINCLVGFRRNAFTLRYIFSRFQRHPKLRNISYKMSKLETSKTYGLFASPLNTKLISKLKANNEDILIFPSITSKKLEITEAFKMFLSELTAFDWLIFTDVFSVDYFIEALRKLEIDLFELDALTVCALGENVSDRLRFVQIHADVIPTKIDCDSVFSVISGFAADNLQDLRFLVLKEKSSKFQFIENLRNANAIVEELAIYEAKFEVETANVKLKTLLKSGAVDEFIFSSAEDPVSLKFLFADEKLAEVLDGVKVSATDENVYQALLENGLRPLYFH